MVNSSKIYVSIASYRDPLLNSTIKSLYVNANKPENITVGCFIQSYEQDRELETPINQPLNEIINWKNVSYQVVNPGSIFSITECRNNALQFLSDDATYVLQVDSHTRFHKDWDLSLLNYIKDLPEKSAISTYLPGWQPLPTGEELVKINNGFFEPNFTTFSKNSLINTREITPENVPIESDSKFLYKSWYLAAHFIFARKELFKCINKQDWVMFWGEELVNSLSAASEGWEVYLPYTPPLAHMYPQDVEYYLPLNKLFKDFPEEWHRNTVKTTENILNMLNNVTERQGFNQSGLDKVNSHLGYDLAERFNNFLKDA
jgi:hypothetical protein